MTLRSHDATLVEPTPTGRSPWFVMGFVLLGTVMVALDTTIVNVALPEIRDDLAAGSGIEWVVSIYLLAVCVTQPTSGWLSDRFGLKRVFLTALAVFTVASLGCALAPDLGWLIAFRALQGLGGGLINPVAMSMLIRAFPARLHGRAMATWGTCVMAAPALGPTFGGWLVSSAGWHWLFLINLPIGAFVLWNGSKALPAIKDEALVTPFDTLGLALGPGGLSLFVLGLSEANRWGWDNPATLLCVLGGLVLLAAFVVHELNTEHPLLQVRLLGDRTFALALAVVCVVMSSQYARLVFLPLQLESLRGYSAMKIGLIMSPAAVMAAIAMQVGGRVPEHFGLRRPILLGLGIMAGGALMLARVSPATSIGYIVTCLCLLSFGMGLTMAPGLLAALRTVPDEMVAQASAMRNLSNQVSGAVAVASLGTLLTFRLDKATTVAESQHAYNSVFVAAGLLLLLGIGAVWFLPREVDEVDGLTVRASAALAD